MTRLFLALLVMTLASCATPTPVEKARDEWPRFGAVGDPAKMEFVSIGAISDRKEIAVEGTIAGVCQTKGCWMTLRDDANVEILVRFRDYGFFVPRNAMGRRAIALGTVERSTYSVEALRHLASDAGKTEAEIALITAPKDTITFMADSVWIQGAGLTDPYRPVGAESCPPLDKKGEGVGVRGSG